MSLLNLKRLDSRERDDLALSLERDCATVMKVLRMQHRLLQVYRCACVWGDALSKGRLGCAALEDMCVQCALLDRTIVTEDRNAKLATEALFAPFRGDGENGNGDFSDPSVTRSAEEQARLESMCNSFEYQRLLDQQEDASTAIPAWREREKPKPGVFNKSLSLGSGIRKRHVHSTHAYKNLMGALGGSEAAFSRVIDLTHLRDAFNFVASTAAPPDAVADDAAAEGSETQLEPFASFSEFVKLLIMFVRDFYPDDYADGVLLGMEQFYMEHLLHFVGDNALESVAKIEERWPLQRFPGVPEVLQRTRTVLENVFTLLSGGMATLQRPDFEMFMQWIGIEKMCTASGTVVLQCFNTALRHSQQRRRNQHDSSPVVPAVEAAAPAVPEVDFNGFCDAVALVGFEVFGAKVHRDALPTVASRFYSFVLSWHRWYEGHYTRDLRMDLRPFNVPPPAIRSVVPMAVNARSAASVVVYGSHFPPKGVFVRFGDQVSISSVVLSDGHTQFVNVDVPPAVPDQISVSLAHLRDNGGGASDATDVTSSTVVRVIRSKDVDVGVSVDGRHFYMLHDSPFTYRDLLPDVTLSPHLARLRRVFTNFAALGNLVDSDDALLVKELQWLKFVEEFRLIPPGAGGTAGSSAAAALANRKKKNCTAETVANNSFHRYACDVPIDDGARTVQALSFGGFIKALVLTVLLDPNSPYLTLDDALRSLLADDRWIGRDHVMTDVREAHHGQQSLRVRRAANALPIHRVRTGPADAGERDKAAVAGHANTPRGGLDPLTDSAPILVLGAPAEASALLAGAGEPPQLAAMVDVEGLPKGRWLDEHRHEQLVLEHLTRGELELEAATLRAIGRIRHSGSRGSTPSSPTDSASASGAPSPTAMSAALKSPLPRKAAKKPAERSTASPRGGTPAQAPPRQLSMSAFSPLRRVGSGTGFDASGSSATDTAATLPEAHVRAVIRSETQRAVIDGQRERYNTVCRREADERARHLRQLRGLREELDAERQAKAEAQAHLAKHHISTNEDEQVSFFSASKGVLQAEKEELQRIFVQELEKKKQRMDVDRAREDTLADLERDRQVAQLKEQMQLADHMYGRLQDTVRAQATTIEHQTTALRMLKNRVNLFKVDDAFFRETHDQLASAVDKSKHHNLLGEVEENKAKHDAIMMEVAQQMLLEARAEGRRTVQSTKDLLPKKGSQRRGPESATDASAHHSVVAGGRELASEKSGFFLPDVPNMLVTLTLEEAEARAAAAAAEVESRKEAELEELRQEIQRQRAELEEQNAVTHEREKEQLQAGASPHAPCGDMSVSGRAGGSTAHGPTQGHHSEIGGGADGSTEAALDVVAADSANSRVIATVDGSLSGAAQTFKEGDALEWDREGTAAATGSASPTSRTPAAASPAGQPLRTGSPSPTAVASDGDRRDAEELAGAEGWRGASYSRAYRDFASSEAQTDDSGVAKAKQRYVRSRTALDEYAKYFGASHDIIFHSIAPSETAESIAALYEVRVIDLLRANFLVPPDEVGDATSASDGDEDTSGGRREGAPPLPSSSELALALHGIPSKQLRVPVAAGTRAQAVQLAHARRTHGGTEGGAFATAEAALRSPQARRSPALSATQSDEAAVVSMGDGASLAAADEALNISVSEFTTTVGGEATPQPRQAAVNSLASHAQSLREDLRVLRADVAALPALVVGEMAQKLKPLSLRTTSEDAKGTAALRTETGAEQRSAKAGESTVAAGVARARAAEPRNGATQEAADHKDHLQQRLQQKRQQRLYTILLGGSPTSSGYHEDSGGSAPTPPLQAQWPSCRAAPVVHRVVHDESVGRNRVVRVPPGDASTLATGAVAAQRQLPPPELSTGAIVPGHERAHNFDAALHTLLHDEIVRRLVVIAAAEKFFNASLLRHRHLWALHVKTRSREKLFGCGSEARREQQGTQQGTARGGMRNEAAAGENAVVGVATAVRSHVLTHRQLEERNMRDMTQRRRREDDERRRQMKEKKLVQLESRAANAVRLKRMLQEHIAAKHAPTKITYVPKRERDGAFGRPKAGTPQPQPLQPQSCARADATGRRSTPPPPSAREGGSTVVGAAPTRLSPLSGGDLRAASSPGGTAVAAPGRLHPLFVPPQNSEARRQLEMVAAADELLRARRIHSEQQSLAKLGIPLSQRDLFLEH